MLLFICKSGACWRVCLNLCSCLFSSATNEAKPTTIRSIFWFMALWLTVGGPRTNARSHALLSIRRHNGHGKTLNYSLCKINMFPASPDEAERKAGRGSVQERRRRRHRRRRRCRRRRKQQLPRSQLQPLLNLGDIIFMVVLPGPGGLDHCDRMTLTAMAAQSSLFPSLSWYFSSAAWGRKKKKKHKQSRGKKPRYFE